MLEAFVPSNGTSHVACVVTLHIIVIQRFPRIFSCSKRAVLTHQFLAEASQHAADLKSGPINHSCSICLSCSILSGQEKAEEPGALRLPRRVLLAGTHEVKDGGGRRLGVSCVCCCKRKPGEPDELHLSHVGVVVFVKHTMEENCVGDAPLLMFLRLSHWRSSSLPVTTTGVTRRRGKVLFRDSTRDSILVIGGVISGLPSHFTSDACSLVS